MVEYTSRRTEIKAVKCNYWYDVSFEHEENQLIMYPWNVCSDISDYSVRLSTQLGLSVRNEGHRPFQLSRNTWTLIASGDKVSFSHRIFMMRRGRFIYLAYPISRARQRSQRAPLLCDFDHHVETGARSILAGKNM